MLIWFKLGVMYIFIKMYVNESIIGRRTDWVAFQKNGPPEIDTKMISQPAM